MSKIKSRKIHSEVRSINSSLCGAHNISSRDTRARLHNTSVQRYCTSDFNYISATISPPFFSSIFHNSAPPRQPPGGPPWPRSVRVCAARTGVRPVRSVRIVTSSPGFLLLLAFFRSPFKMSSISNDGVELRDTRSDVVDASMPMIMCIVIHLIVPERIFLIAVRVCIKFS